MYSCSTDNEPVRSDNPKEEAGGNNGDDEEEDYGQEEVRQRTCQEDQEADEGSRREVGAVLALCEALLLVPQRLHKVDRAVHAAVAAEGDE